MKSIDFGFVADLYDTYVNVDFDIDFYSKLSGKYRGKCLELMCGTGRVSLPLLKQGIDLTCVDYSEEMLAVFRKKAKELDIASRIECQDVCELNLDDIYDMIFIPFNSFSEITDSKRQEYALERIHMHLSDKGVFFCTLYNPEYRIKTADGFLRVLGRFHIDENKSLVISYYNQYNEKTKNVTGIQFYEIYDKNNRLIDKRYLDICFSLIDKEDFIEMAERAGFKVIDIFGDYNYSPFSEESMFMNFLMER
ncbi:MAG TPA: methyltransferase domain-containing protein [Clostridia bacterium]|nr:methyltransferase domain-containing protein [Clostridia bacterium]